MPRSVPQVRLRHMVPVHSPETNGQVGRLLLGGAVGMQGVHGAVGQAGYMPQDQLAWPTISLMASPRDSADPGRLLHVMGQARPAAFDELLVGLP